MTKENLHQTINSAFSDVPYPGDNNLGVSGGGYDSELVTTTLRGKDWRAIQPTELSRITLNFMTPEAFHYFLPAYLLIAHEEDNGDPGGSLDNYLTPPELGDFGVNREFHHLFDGFSVDQKKAIHDYLFFSYQELILWHKEMGDFDNRSEDYMEKINTFWEKLIDYWFNFCNL